MGPITTVGLDIAKSVFQVHAIDADGQVVVRRQLKRAQLLRFFGELPPALVGIEACSTAHHWARELQRFGHDVRLLPPAYVKPYVKRQKNDAADAEAIAEAVTRPTMRFVPIKTVEQQSAATLHRSRPLGQAADHVAACRPRPSGRVRDRRGCRNCTGDASRRRTGAG